MNVTAAELAAFFDLCRDRAHATGDPASAVNLILVGFESLADELADAELSDADRRVLDVMQTVVGRCPLPASV